MPPASSRTAGAATRLWKPPPASSLGGLLLAAARQRGAGQRHVADLARAAGRAPQEHAAEHDRRADTFVDVGQHEVVVVLRRALVLLGDGGEIDVVLDGDRGAEDLGQLGEQGARVPARQVRGVPELTGVRVDGAGGADHGGRDVVVAEPGPSQGAVESLGDELGGAVAHVVGDGDGLDTAAAALGAGDVGDHGGDPGGVRGDGHDVGGAGVDLVQHGVRPRAAGLAARGAHQAHRFQ